MGTAEDEGRTAEDEGRTAEDEGRTVMGDLQRKHPDEPRPIIETIAERAKLHGDFTNTAMCAQRLKDDMRAWMPGWHALRPYQREALDQIAQKIARILTGNPDEPDHWRDISGYATMVEIRLTK